ncbi:MAG: hypothetical protein ACJAT7_001300 [Psychromonas sp.]|jgi:hypothetical protein
MVLLALGFPIRQLGNDGGGYFVVLKDSTPSSSRCVVEDLVAFMVLLALGFPTKQLGNDAGGFYSGMTAAGVSGMMMRGQLGNKKVGHTFLLPYLLHRVIVDLPAIRCNIVFTCFSV